MTGVVVINKHELSDKCAEAIHDFVNADKSSGSDSVLIMTLCMFSSLLVSKVFEGEEGQDNETVR